MPALDGMMILDLTQYEAGTSCTQMLAWLGADVVKVEHPRAGDLARLLEPLASGESGNFARLNRDKRSLAIDLKREESRDAFRRRVRTTNPDVEQHPVLGTREIARQPV